MRGSGDGVRAVGGCLLVAAVCAERARAQQVVVSQVYGGAGCGTLNCSTYQNDFIEILNAGQNPVNLGGWSVQYAAATSSNWQVTSLPAVTLAAGQYFLVAEASGPNGTNPLPTPDASGSISMAATAGKVAVVKTATALSGSCPSSLDIADLVGYGATASCNEGGSNAPAPGTVTSATRKNAGCADSNVNGADFEAIAAAPRNTSSPLHVCTPPDHPSGSAAVSPNPAPQGSSVTITVMVTPAANPPSTGLAVQADTTAIGGVANEVFAHIGGNVFMLARTLSCSQAIGAVTLPATITDAQGRTGSLSIMFSVISGAAAIVTQPSDVLACAGKSASVSVVASGTGLSYQWYSQAGPLSNGADVSGATEATLTLSNLGAAQAEASPYFVRITGTCDPDNPVESTHVNLALGGATAADRQVVISQIYAGAGCTGAGCAVYDADYIELFNRGTGPVDLSGWSVQYASPAGAWQTTSLGDFTLLPGQYYLIREASGGAGTAQRTLPPASARGSIALSATSGRVALYASTIAIPGSECPVSSGDCFLVDFVGYGSSTTCFEGSGAATSPGTANCLRRSPVCTDSNWNAGDFLPEVPAPHAAAPGGTGVAADLNFDGRVDAGLAEADDFDVFLACMADPRHPLPYPAGSLPAGCNVPRGCDGRIQADLDRNGVLDLNDFARVQRCLGFGVEPGVPASCGD